MRAHLTRFFAVLVLAVAAVAATGSAHPAAATQSLEGPWMVGIHFNTPGLEDCASPTLNSSDGGIIAESCSLVESAGYGRWARTGNGEFAITFIGQGYDLGTGATSYRYKVRAQVTLDPVDRKFSGPFVTDIFAPDGTLLFSAEGTVTGDPIEVEPLS